MALQGFTKIAYFQLLNKFLTQVVMNVHRILRFGGIPPNLSPNLGIQCTKPVKF